MAESSIAGSFVESAFEPRHLSVVHARRIPLRARGSPYPPLRRRFNPRGGHGLSRGRGLGR